MIRCAAAMGPFAPGYWLASCPYWSAHWDIQPGGDSAQDIQIADTVRHNLSDGMTITWDDFAAYPAHAGLWVYDF